MVQRIEALTEIFQLRPNPKDSGLPKPTLIERFKYPYTLAATAVRTRRERREETRQAELAAINQTLSGIIASLPEDMDPEPEIRKHANGTADMILRRIIHPPQTVFDRLLLEVVAHDGEFPLDQLPEDLREIATPLPGVIAVHGGKVQIPSILKKQE